MSTFVRIGTSFAPGISGTTARAPTSMKMRGAVSSSPLTATTSRPAKRAWPRISSTFAMASSQISLPVRESRITLRARAATAGMSTMTGPEVEKP